MSQASWIIKLGPPCELQNEHPGVDAGGPCEGQYAREQKKKVTLGDRGTASASTPSSSRQATSSRPNFHSIQLCRHGGRNMFADAVFAWMLMVTSSFCFRHLHRVPADAQSFPSQGVRWCAQCKSSQKEFAQPLGDGRLHWGTSFHQGKPKRWRADPDPVLDTTLAWQCRFVHVWTQTAFLVLFWLKNHCATNNINTS